MTGPRPGSYDGSVYARGGYLAAPAASRPPAFQRGLPARAAVTWLTVAEVAAVMRVSKMTVYRLIHSGELSAARFGRSFRVTERSLELYEQASAVTASDSTHPSTPSKEA